ncbi:MAG: HAMP domain-containing sensor histidine kinase [Rubrivivax sp.]
MIGTQAADRAPLQAAAAGRWCIGQGRLQLDEAARSLLGCAECETSLDGWLARLPAAEAAALAAALDNAAAPLAAVVSVAGRQVLLRGAFADGAWQGLALELPEPPANATPSTRDELFAGVSHELRTPLNAILGFTHLARAELPPEVDRSHVDHIERASHLMLRVVNDLLDLVRLEAGRLEIAPDQPLDLHALVARVGVLAAGLRQGKPIRLYTVVDPECPQHLRGDAVRVEQVLVNLIGNALKYTERGKVVLGVKLRARRDDEVTLRLSVSDTGVGIGLDHLDRIGRPFERASRRAGGSGLGLSVVRRLLELHGTQLQVASVEGGGTICWFDLTLALDAAAVAPTPVADTVVFSTDRRFAETVATQWREHGHALRNTAQAKRARRWIVDADLPEAAERIAQARRGGHDCVVASAGPAAAGRPAVDLPLLATNVLPARASTRSPPTRAWPGCA